jgi:hypothetical protein
MSDRAGEPRGGLDGRQAHGGDEHNDHSLSAAAAKIAHNTLDKVASLKLLND